MYLCRKGKGLCQKQITLRHHLSLPDVTHRVTHFSRNVSGSANREHVCRCGREVSRGRGEFVWFSDIQLQANYEYQNRNQTTTLPTLFDNTYIFRSITQAKGGK